MKTKLLLQEFSSLTHQEKEHFIAALIDQWESEEGKLPFIMNELEENRIKLPQCIHCTNINTLRRGKIKGIQRYSCKLCGKYWMATHGTSLAGLQKKFLWKKYIQAFLKGLSIRKSALEVGVCIQTSFRWRHRLLSSISCYLPQSIGGIIESADFQLPFSRKGERNQNNQKSVSNNPKTGKIPDHISVVISVCRGKQDSLSSVIKASSLSKAHVSKAIYGKILHGSIHITKDTVLYSQYSRSEVIEHLCIKTSGKPKKRDLININAARKSQTVFLEFLIPFKGVATKYLQNYLNWHHFKEYTHNRFDKVKQAMIASLAGDQALEWLEDLTINDTINIT